ncbi:MAG: hypothetical protein AAFV07_05655 [Bacteroidota bacterium]
MEDTSAFEAYIQGAVVPAVLAGNGLDLDTFLVATEGCYASEGEQLRQLGIALQDEGFPNLNRSEHWALLAQVYDHACALEPDNYHHPHSKAISALNVLQMMQAEQDPSVPLLRAEAELALKQAASLEQEDPHIFYTWGLLCYFTGEDKALQRFQQALDLDQGYYMARLYKGHLLFDNQRWDQALEAFRQVDQSRLLVEWPVWRGVLLAELIAVCWLKLGQEAAFEEALTAFIHMFQSFDPEELEAPSYIRQALIEARSLDMLRWLEATLGLQ